MKKATAAQLVPDLRTALTTQLGLAFDESRGTELEGIIEARLRARRSNAATYRDELRAGLDSKELAALSSLVTVSETFFFRHEHQLQVGLARIIEVAKDRPEQRPCRILSMGCASGEEAYTLAMVLADAMGAIRRLRFDRRIPPGIVMNHRVGRGEVEARAAGLQADEKQRAIGVGLEAFDVLLAIAGFAIEVFVGDLPLVEPAEFDQREVFSSVRRGLLMIDSSRH